jgi:hypothetical protein
MSQVVEAVPAENRWAIATQAMTGAVMATNKAMLDAVGRETYDQILGQIWGGAGQGFKEIADALGLSVDDAKSVAEAFASLCAVTMGPEVQMETAEATEARAVLRATGCPFLNRVNEFGIEEDLLTAGDAAFCEALTESLNPNVTVTHDKRMHLGDPYCEWVFELQT